MQPSCREDYNESEELSVDKDSFAIDQRDNDHEIEEGDGIVTRSLNS